MHATRSRMVGLGTTCTLHVHVSLDQEQYARYTSTCRWIRNNMHDTRSRIVGLGTNMYATRSRMVGLGTTCTLHVHVSLDQETYARYTFTCCWIRNNMHATRSRVVGLGTTCMLHVHVSLDQEHLRNLLSLFIHMRFTTCHFGGKFMIYTDNPST